MDSSRDIIKKLREGRLLREGQDYEGKDTKELVKLAQGGDQFAIETLVNQYQDFINMMSRKWHLYNSDDDDVKQMVTIAFWEAIQKWDGSGNFEAFAGMIIKRKMTDELRKEDAGKSQINIDADSLDRVVKTQGHSQGDDMETTLGDMTPDKSLSPEEQYLGNDGARKITDFIKNELSDVERQVILKYIDGYKVSEITEETGMKYKSVENAIMRVKGKLSDYLKSMKESRRLRMNESIFSDKEKEILKSVLSKIDGDMNESKEINESNSISGDKFIAVEDSPYVLIYPRDKEGGYLKIKSDQNGDSVNLSTLDSSIINAIKKASGLKQIEHVCNKSGYDCKKYDDMDYYTRLSLKLKDSKDVEEHLEVAPNDSTPISKQVAYVKEMVEKAKNVSGSVSADDAMHYAWDIVDFLHDSMLLDKIPLDESKKMRESEDSYPLRSDWEEERERILTHCRKRLKSGKVSPYVLMMNVGYSHRLNTTEMHEIDTQLSDEFDIPLEDFRVQKKRVRH